MPLQEVVFENIMIIDVDAGASSNNLCAAMVRHIKQKGGGYMELPHDPVGLHTIWYMVYGCQAMVPDGHGIICTLYRIVILKVLSVLVRVPYSCLQPLTTVYPSIK